MLDFLRAWFTKKHDLSSYDDQTLLDVKYFDEGWIDSVEIMNLIMDLEEEFQVRFTELHFQDQRIFSISGLVEIVEEMKAT